MSDNPYRYMPEADLLKMYRRNIKKSESLMKAGYGGRANTVMLAAKAIAFELDRRADDRERR